MNQLNLHETSAPPLIPSRDLAILVAEDDNYLRRLLQLSLQQDGYEPVLVCDGRAALDQFQAHGFDLVMLDIQMPILDGIEVCQEIRQISDVPIIMITAMDQPDDIVRSLEVGADDYITKPFNFRVLQAHVQAILRRLAWLDEKPNPTIMTVGNVTVNDETHEVYVDTTLVHLTTTEYKLLRYLMLHHEETVSQAKLLHDIWHVEQTRKNSVLEAAIRRLRQKIEVDPSNPEYVVTIMGHGYRFQADTSEPPPLIPALSLQGNNQSPDVSDIEFHESSQGVVVRGDWVRLSKTEHRLLGFFLQHRDCTLTKETLADEVWGPDSAGAAALVTATVQRLRRKIEADPTQPGYIVTIRGEGYRFCSDGQGW